MEGIEQEKGQQAASGQVDNPGSRRDFLRKSAAGVGAAVAAGASAATFSADTLRLVEDGDYD